jgi:hypothetical protein
VSFLVPIIPFATPLTSDSRQSRRILHGVIYLHRITDDRVGGTARQAFKAFLKLCGNQALENVALVTTMWDRPEVRRNRVTYEAREKELLRDRNFFKPAIELGAQVFRHSNSKSSADRIISRLLGNTPVYLGVQQELARGRDIKDTEAGRAALEILRSQTERCQQDIEEWDSEIKEAKRQKDRRALDEAKAEREEAAKEKKAANKEIKNFSKNFDKKLDAAVKEFEETDS